MSTLCYWWVFIHRPHSVFHWYSFFNVLNDRIIGLGKWYYAIITYIETSIEIMKNFLFIVTCGELAQNLQHWRQSQTCAFNVLAKSTCWMPTWHNDTFIFMNTNVNSTLHLLWSTKNVLTMKYLTMNSIDSVLCVWPSLQLYLIRYY